MKFKVGDKVRLKSNGSYHCEGYEYFIAEVNNSTGVSFYRERVNDGLGEREEVLELVNSTKNNMNLIEKAVLAVTPEPQKSFRKAGITNGDGILTDEGAKVFLTYLLVKNEADFKTAVVDGILAEMKDEK